MTAKFVLRGYRAGDLDAMFRLDAVCFAPPFRFSRAVMRRFAEARNARVVIAESGAEMVGFGIWHRESVQREHIGYVMTLDVAEDWRRRGVARRLMEEMERQAAAEGCRAMLLHVFTGNEGAIRFYERAGYVREYEDEGFYGAGLNAWVYRRAF